MTNMIGCQTPEVSNIAQNLSVNVTLHMVCIRKGTMQEKIQHAVSNLDNSNNNGHILVQIITSN